MDQGEEWIREGFEKNMKLSWEAAAREKVWSILNNNSEGIEKDVREEISFEMEP